METATGIDYRTMQVIYRRAYRRGYRIGSRYNEKYLRDGLKIEKPKVPLEWPSWPIEKPRTQHEGEVVVVARG